MKKFQLFVLLIGLFTIGVFAQNSVGNPYLNTAIELIKPIPMPQPSQMSSGIVQDSLVLPGDEEYYKRIAEEHKAEMDRIFKERATTLTILNEAKALTDIHKPGGQSSSWRFPMWLRAIALVVIGLILFRLFK